MRLPILLLALTLTLPACGSDLLPTDGTVFLDPSLPTAARQGALEALAEWNATGATQLTYTDDAYPCDAVITFGGKSRGFAGWTSTRTAGDGRRQPPRISLYLTTVPYYKSVALHELGHAMGLPHAHTGIMADGSHQECVDRGALDSLGRDGFPTCAE